MKKRMNRLVCMLLTIVMLLGLLPTQAFAAGANTTSTSAKTNTTSEVQNPFNDVDETDWFYDGVQYARVNGFFSGTSAEKFNASGTMTRSMFVTVLGRMAGIDPADYAGDSGFSDVPSSAYYAPYVNWAAKYGITTGSGDGTFSPDTEINREQMAVFFVRYFEAFGVELKTETNITTIPEDIDSVSPYARDAVLKLWKTGLLNGDGKDFNPKGNASRAQAAVVCMRTDKVVDTWYTEPGVPSTRVSVDPKAEQPAEEKPQTPTTGGSSGSGNGGGGSNTTYYEVKFEMGTGEDGTGVTLPDTKTYAANTKITSLPTPYKQNGIFLNWYYDAAMTQVVSAGDAISRNMTLYAKMADGGQNLAAVETPNYITKTEVGTDFFFKVKAADAAAVNSALTICNITQTNAAVTYSVSGGNAGVFTVTPAGLKDGQTYQAQLAEDAAAIFVDDDGTEQPSSIRELNFLTAKEDVLNLSLNSQIRYIPNTRVSGMTGTALDGLFTASVAAAQSETTLTENKTVGTFTYEGNDLQVGDTAAIYAGDVSPEDRTLYTKNDGDVAYVTITAIAGNTYTYQTADSADVLFTPDILPVADTDGATDNSSITVPLETMDFTSDAYTALGLDSQTTIDVGDYILFYTGTFGSTSEEASYAEITAVTKNDEAYIIDYKAVSEDTVMSAMDLYNTRNDKVELTDQQIKAMEADMETQALESGFADDAARYLTALALETDGFRELSDDFDLDLSSYSVTTMDGQPLQEGELSLMAGGNVETDISVEATVAGGQVLQHFGNKSGVRAELALTITITINKKVEINVTAVFEQEILLNLNTSGGAIWKWKWIFPYIYDYSLNANFEVGTFTGIGITATAKTIGEEDEAFDWKPVTGNKYEQKILDIGKQITDLMDAKDQFLGEKMVDENGEEIEWNGSGGGGLAEKYANMIEEADTTWIDLFRQEIFSSEGQVDPFHILCYGISADFVVSANMYVTLGMTFEYEVAKQYNFSIMLFHKQSTNETIDLKESRYQFDFYVMGTLGIRAGVELEVAVGLFSLKLDSIGITAEAGAYAQLWGYFYYSLSWSESQGQDSKYSGAMYIDIGMYLKISFKAQLFSSEKLTYQPTLYENQWPLWHVGERQNITDFDLSQGDDDWAMDIVSVKQISLPATFFDMKSMDLTTGEQHGSDADSPAVNFDDSSESHYVIELSDNTHFSYNPANNTIIITPNDEVNLDCEMTIVWKNGALAFTSRPIKRTLSIDWSDPKNLRYIAFDSKGGSIVNTVTSRSSGSYTVPQNPIKTGYTFGGWYSDEGLAGAPYLRASDAGTQKTMHDDTNGMLLYAKWLPSMNTAFTVSYYMQELNGKYNKVTDPDVLAAIDSTSGRHTGTTDRNVNTAFSSGSYTIPAGYKLNTTKSTDPAAITIQPNGSTELDVYFERLTYTLTFTYGDKRSEVNGDVVYRFKYDAAVNTPRLVLGGYVFDKWNDTVAETMPATDLTYDASWKPDSNTPYRVEVYIQDAATGSNKYFFESAASHLGTTDASLTDGSLPALPDVCASRSKITVDGKEVSDLSAVKIKADGSLVVKCYYDRKTYDVAFATDGGSPVSTRSVRHGGMVTQPLAPTKTGYTFGGWYSGETKWVFDTNTVTGPMTLTAHWNAASGIGYTVEHYKQALSGSGYVIDNSLTEQLTGVTGATATATSKKITGFTFDSSNESNVVSKPITPDGATVLKLYYNRNSYSVSFDTDSGSTAPAQQNIPYGGKAAAPSTPTKAGYTFNGWYSGDSKWAFDTKTVTGDVKLTAHWNIIDYAISYTLNGGTVQNANPENYTAATASFTLHNPTRPGYSFKGWSGTDLSGDATTTVTVAMGSTENRSYTANWTANTYTVAFNGNGSDDGSMANDTLTYDTAKTLSCGFTRTGYTFTGWKLDNKGDLIPAADVKNLTAEAGATVTLYAQWTEADNTSYTVKHYQQNVTGTEYTQADTETKYGVTGTSTQAAAKSYAGFTAKDFDQGAISADGNTVISIYYDRITYTVAFNAAGGAPTPDNQTIRYGGKVVEPPEINREGHHLASWKNGASDWSFATDTVTGAMTLTANWALNSSVNYKVEVYQMDTSGYYPSTATSSETRSAPEGTAVSVTDDDKLATGFTLDDAAANVLTKATLAEGDVLKVYLKRNQYTLTWKIDADTTHSTATVYYGAAITAPTVSKLGFDFTGWSPKVPTTMPTEDQTFTATWTAKSYTVTLNANEGTINEGNVTSYKYGTGATLPTNVTKTGYTFAGWYEKQNLSGTAVTAISTSDSGDKVYYAKWDPWKYTVSFPKDQQGDPDSGTMASYTMSYGETHTFECLYLKTGYRFKEWNTAADGSGKGYPEENLSNLTTTEKLVNLYAQWEPITYSVHFDLNGASGEPIADTQASYITQAQLPDASRTGYTFLGWTEDKAGSGVKYKGTGPVKWTAVDGATITLYAQWGSNQYSITFNSNGGSEVAAITQDYGTELSAPSSPTKTGYTFGRWYTDNGTFAKAYEFSTMPDENVTLYAKWTPISYIVRFDPNGGEGSMDDQICVYDVRQQLNKNTFTRKNHRTTSWNLDPSGTGTSYSTPTSVLNLSATDGEIITLYAFWREYRVRVNYLLDGGTLEGAQTMFHASDTYTLPKPTKEGYCFNGWTMEPAYAVKDSVKLESSDGINYTLTIGDTLSIPEGLDSVAEVKLTAKFEKAYDIRLVDKDDVTLHTFKPEDPFQQPTGGVAYGLADHAELQDDLNSGGTMTFQAVLNNKSFPAEGNTLIIQASELTPGTADGIGVTHPFEMSAAVNYAAYGGDVRSIKLNSDITVTDTALMDMTLKCTFDGNGKTITYQNDGADKKPLFKTVEPGAVVKNLTLVSTGTGTYSGTPANDPINTWETLYYAGGIAGFNSGTIQNCTVTGSIKATRDNGAINEKMCIGGIAGGNTGSITGCTVGGTVATYVEGYYAGGIVSRNAGTITGCTVGTSSSTVDTYVEGYFAGGIVGYSNCTTSQIETAISNCTVTGSVSVSGSTAGGVVGDLQFCGYGAIASSACSAVVEIKYYSGMESAIGGIVGNIYRNTTTASPSSLSNVTFSGTLKCNAEYNSSGLQRVIVGGIVGRLWVGKAITPESYRDINGFSIQNAVFNVSWVDTVGGTKVGGVMGYATKEVGNDNIVYVYIIGDENSLKFASATTPTATGSYSGYIIGQYDVNVRVSKALQNPTAGFKSAVGLEWGSGSGLTFDYLS